MSKLENIEVVSRKSRIQWNACLLIWTSIGPHQAYRVFIYKIR